MNTWRIDCELLDEVVVTERSATAGARRSLDYLPGAAFLGAAASRLYAELGPEDAFTVFHSGKIRFCNATPLGDNKAAMPVPLCLHERKSEPAGRDQLESALVFNFIDAQAQEACRAGGGQPRQLRSAWLCDSGRLLRPARAFRLKTAVDETTGRAAEGQLFGYESLLPGSRFAGAVQFDEDVPAALRDRVLACLKGTLRLGRSRSAQYGRVRCTLVDQPVARVEVQAGTRLVLWLASDLAASAKGVPTFNPELADLGLQTPGRLDVGASFVRTRRYAPYNAHRRLPDVERQVIVAGSVLVYVLDAPLVDADRALLAAGVGLWREAGLGQVCVNPPLLAGMHPAFGAPQSSPAASVVKPEHPLLGWLEELSGKADGGAKQRKWVEEAVREWARLQESARRFAGLADFAAAGPSATQWGRVEAAGKDTRGDLHGLHQALFGEHGICRHASDWEKAFGPGWDVAHMRDWLKGRLSASEMLDNSGLAIARLAGAIQKAIIQGTWRGMIGESGNAN